MAIGLPDMVSFWEKAFEKGLLDSIDSVCPYVLAPKGALRGDENSTNQATILRRLIQTASMGKGKISCDLEDLFDYIHSCPILSLKQIDVEALKKTFYLYHTCERSNPSHGGNLSKTDFSNFVRNFAPYKSNIDTWLADVLGCIKLLRNRLYAAYLIDDSDQWTSNVENAMQCYSFLPQIFPKDNHPVIFTTNYDTVFDALEVSGNLKALNLSLQNGVAYNEEKRRSYFALKNYLQDKTGSTLFLFRMHGSVAWERKERKGRSAIIDHFPNKHSIRAEIIEPVISKELPRTEPFRGLYNIFKQVIQTNNVLISIGFSYRDDAIRAIIEEALEKNKFFQVICIAPPCEKVPEIDRFMSELENNYGDRFHWMKERFGIQETAQKIVESVRNILM